MGAVLRNTGHLLAPGITLFVVPLIVSVVARSLPPLLLVGALFYEFRVIPIALILAIAALSFLYWRRHWLSGSSLVCAAPLVIVAGFFPNPVNSTVGWAANVLKVAALPSIPTKHNACEQTHQTKPLKK
jgi:hypothetical protein